MGDYTKEIGSPWAVISSQQFIRGWDFDELAFQLQCSTDRLDDLRLDTTGVDYELSIALERVFGRSAESWLILQHNYDFYRHQCRRNKN